MTNKNKRKVANLSRLMNYILGNRPYEFGLVPDKEGYISLKELLKTINEEPNMAYVRESHIREVLLNNRDSLFEINERKIRSTNRHFLPVNKEKDVTSPPKILFKGVKRKTYPFILRSGLLQEPKRHIVLTKDKDLAVRIARRLDQKPIILEIRAGTAAKNGITFYPFGHSLYLADRVPVQFINGPPLPKEPPSKKETLEKEREIAPGSFIMKAERDPDIKRQKRAKKRIWWKEEVKKAKKRKRTGPSPWPIHGLRD